jgi:DNA invertase Pin-like site-specific DNA recombinase
MTTATAYIRVSSRAQDHATQRAAIERIAAARGDVITEWFAEKKSAKTMARAELHRLRAVAREGCISKLYVFRLDRLTRSGIRDTFELVEDCALTASRS